MRNEVFPHHSVSVTKIAFQACLIDRSSISPSLESITYVGSGNSGRWIPEILAPSPERLAN